MYDYADDHGRRLPPAALCDKQGRPLLSWRVLLLPYLEERWLYKQFRLDEPWDGPHNSKLLARMPRVYAPPGDLPVKVKADPASTFYQVFTGRGAAFEGTEGLRLPGDFPDGTSNTILVIEAGEAVPWTKPADLPYDPAKPLPRLGGIFTGEGRFSLFGSSRIKGFHVALGDCSIRWITPEISEKTLRDAITRNDGRILGPDW
jgi:hypothetical protein